MEQEYEEGTYLALDFALKEACCTNCIGSGCDTENGKTIDCGTCKGSGFDPKGLAKLLDVARTSLYLLEVGQEDSGMGKGSR